MQNFTDPEKAKLSAQVSSEFRSSQLDHPSTDTPEQLIVTEHVPMGEFPGVDDGSTEVNSQYEASLNWVACREDQTGRHRTQTIIDLVYVEEEYTLF